MYSISNNDQLGPPAEVPNEALPILQITHRLLTLPLTKGTIEERTRNTQSEPKRWKRRACYHVTLFQTIQATKKGPLEEVKMDEEINPPRKTPCATHEGINSEHPNFLAEAMSQLCLSS